MPGPVEKLQPVRVHPQAGLHGVDDQRVPAERRDGQRPEDDERHQGDEGADPGAPRAAADQASQPSQRAPLEDEIAAPRLARAAPPEDRRHQHGHRRQRRRQVEDPPGGEEMEAGRREEHAGEERAQPAQEERRPRHQARRQVVRHGEVAGAEDDRRKRAREHLEAGHGPPS
jgi:hypothetical protein